MLNCLLCVFAPLRETPFFLFLAKAQRRKEENRSGLLNPLLMVAGARAVAGTAIAAAAAAHAVMGAVVAAGAAIEGRHLLADAVMAAGGAIQAFAAAAHANQLFEDDVALLTFELVKRHDYSP
jgi:hypothetical protein